MLLPSASGTHSFKDSHLLWEVEGEQLQLLVVLQTPPIAAGGGELELGVHLSCKTQGPRLQPSPASWLHWEEAGVGVRAGNQAWVL